MTHQCDDECVCPIDGKPLTYWPAGGQHACQDPDCANAHGVLPELTREDAVEAMQDMAGELYRAEDRLAFVREMCDQAERDGSEITVARLRSWLAYNGCGGAIELTRPEADRLAADLLAGRVKARKARIVDAGREPAVLAISNAELGPLLALADDEHSGPAEPPAPSS